ncbi:MAG: hypothetical protein K9N35_02345 [Candidatus Marinimicrobia bacterium]|nr:hypothetical protein [Candidatus Neomarinimicrobiota bacterium]
MQSFSLNIIKLFVGVLLLLIAGCEKEAELGNTYHYKAYDELGLQIVEGTFSIEYGDSTNISGPWNFEAIGNPEGIGEQVGNGVFLGTVTGDTFAVDLNPEYVDNNVNLYGMITGDLITGEWSFSGIMGVINQGSFTAQK